MASGQLHQLPHLVLLHSLKLLLHGGLPHWIALGFRVSCRLASMREVELGEESRRLTWRRVVAEDVLHRAVAEGLIIVGCIEPVLVILQRRGVLDLWHRGWSW